MIEDIEVIRDNKAVWSCRFETFVKTCRLFFIDKVSQTVKK